MRKPKKRTQKPTPVVPAAPTNSPIALGLLDEKRLRSAVKQMAVQLPPLMPGPQAGGARSGLVIAKAKELAKASSWKLFSALNRERMVSPDGRHMIVFATGNERTGRPSADVSHGKGWIEQLVVQRELPFIEAERGPELWLLLFHRCVPAGEIRYELSRPTGMFNGRVTEWGERHHFPPIKLRKSATARVRRPPEDTAAPPAPVAVPAPRKK